MSNRRIHHYRSVREPGWNTKRFVDKQARTRPVFKVTHTIHTNFIERLLILCNLYHKKEKLQKKNPGLIYRYDFEDTL